MNNSHPQFFAAIASGDTDAVRRFLEKGVSPNRLDADGQPALIRACEVCETGNIQMIELLLSRGADINTRGIIGETPLMVASVGCEDTARMLLLYQPGADPHLCGDQGINALLGASGCGYITLTRMLLDRHANPDHESMVGTPLLLAAFRGHSKIVNLLIKAGASVDKTSSLFKDSHGCSPLLVAALQGHTECVRVLLASGANAKLRADDGRTALMIAKAGNHTEVVRLLESYQNDGWNALGRLAARGVHGVRRAADSFTSEITKSSEQTRSYEALSESAKAEADPQALSVLLDDLNGLVGLSNVKSDVAKHISLVRVQQMRREKGLSVPEQSLHMVFSGNPGTGKTSVARLIAKIYKQMGILSKGQFVETDRAGLVAEYLGQTAPKVQAVVKKAISGVLFIDEAYTLSGNERGGDQFGQEAIDTLLKLMEDHRNDLIVIVAGYTEPMQRFIESNPGLQSRFNKYLHFEDYSPDDLTSIFTRLAKQHDYELTAAAQAKVTSVFQQAYQNRTRTFGNARLSRNLFEKAISDHAMRIGSLPHVSESDLVTIAAEDIQL